MNNKFNFYSILEIILFLNLCFSKNIYTRNNEILKNNNDISLYKENYYIVFINSTVSSSTSSTSNNFINKNSKKKRNDFENENENENENIKKKEILINSLVDKIHNLIIDNKNTFKNITKFEEIENKNPKLNKRNFEYAMDYGDSNFVYSIGSVGEKTIFAAYLSEDLIESVKKIPRVINCVQNRKFKSMAYYNKNYILKETQWNGLNVRNNTDLHLSLISQGIYDEKLINQYDTNYYYPKSAGKDVDLYILDSGFNLKNEEFSNTHERSVKCEGVAYEGKISENLPLDKCYGDIKKDHGSKVADAAAGIKHGVANKANLHLIVHGNETLDLISNLIFVRDHLKNPHKTVINCSFGEYYTYDRLKSDEILITISDLFKELTNKGVIVVAAAGNDCEILSINDEVTFPCVLDDVICVGGIESINLEENKEKIMISNNYKKASFSNQGYGVNIYAPFFANVSYIPFETGIYTEEIVIGTSFSSPIVAGVISTILSEFPKKKFNKESMFNYLSEVGEKNVLKGLSSKSNNLLINNGKRIVYSRDNIYHGCGNHSGNKKCESEKCCSISGECLNMSDEQCFISEGCQDT
ncbi:peptidase S8/S53 domain-containing protein [Neocallimastix sp. 'constans']